MGREAGTRNLSGVKLGRPFIFKGLKGKMINLDEECRTILSERPENDSDIIRALIKKYGRTIKIEDT